MRSGRLRGLAGPLAAISVGIAWTGSLSLRANAWQDAQNPAQTPVPAPQAANASADAPDDTAALYKATCAICHDVPETKAPPTATLRQLPAARILMAMELGKMQPQAAVLKPEQRVRLAQWLAAGRIKYRETVAVGLDAAPQAFLGLLRGENIGKQLVKLI